MQAAFGAVLALLLAAAAYAADATAYLWPVHGVPPKITGVMCEKREDHPHAGVDISLFGRVGVVPIVSVADGALLRLRTSHVGYGNALYVRMAGGKVAVYAHLDHFSPRFEKLAAEIRARTGLQRIDYYAEDWEEPIPIRRGETIAFGGRSGTTTPHLHFELRQDDKVNLNPLTNGFPVKDTVAPTIAAVLFVPIDPDATVDGRAAAKTLRFGRSAAATVRVKGRVGLAVDASDKHAPAGPVLTPYRLEAIVDGRPFFATTYERFSWTDKRLSLVQFDLEPRTRRRFLRLYNPYPVEIPFFSGADAGTFDRLAPGLHKVEVVAADAAGLSRRVAFTIVVDKTAAPEKRPWPRGAGDAALFNSQTVEIAQGRFALEGGENSFFEPLRLSIRPAEPIAGAVGECYAVADPGSPVRQPFGVRFRYAADEPAPGKLAVMRVGPSGAQFLGAAIDGASRSVRGESLEFGVFCLVRDEQPPTVENWRRLPDGRVSFTVADDLTGVDADAVQVWQGDERRVVDFEPHTGQATAVLDRGGGEAVVVARDRAGNVGRWRAPVEAP